MLSFIRTSSHYNVDGEELWNLAIELGSFDKASANLASRGIINEKNGKPLESVILRRIAWMWIINNDKKAYKLLKEKVPTLSEEYWEQFMVNKAYSMFVTYKHNRIAFEAWLEEKGLEKYKDYRKSKYFRTT